jgi:hypothetical protein
MDAGHCVHEGCEENRRQVLFELGTNSKCRDRQSERSFMLKDVPFPMRLIQSVPMQHAEARFMSRCINCFNMAV